MRFNARTAMTTSVPWRASVRERSVSPITRLYRLMSASTNARSLYPDAFCQCMRPRSAMSCKSLSRCVGAVSAVSLGTALERGGTITVASGCRAATSPYTSSRSNAPSPVKDATGRSTWSSRRPTCEPSSTSLEVNSAATISPVSASTPRCNFRQDRRVRAPCFSTSHSPGPHSRRPVLSTSRWTACCSVAAGSLAMSRRVGSTSSGRAQRGQAKKANNRPDQTLGLPQREAEHSPQGERCCNRHSGVVRYYVASATSCLFTRKCVAVHHPDHLFFGRAALAELR